MSRIKEINIKSRTYYFFDGMINIKNFDPSRIKIDKKLDNPLQFIIDKADRYIQESNGNTDKNRDTLKKYTELWNKIKYLIK